MTEIGSELSQPWTDGARDLFLHPRWPLEFPVFGSWDWGRWERGEECAGLWELQDPFPKRLTLTWDAIVAKKAPSLYLILNPALQQKVIRLWEESFVSPSVKLEYTENPLIDPVRRPTEKVPSTDHFVGQRQFVRIYCWLPADCRHPKHPQEGCPCVAREVVPLQPKRGMNYWLAELEDGGRVFQAVLESPERAHFGARGPVLVCWYHQILQLFLHKPARKLDLTWDALPRIIARAQIEGVLLRANHPSED